MGIAHPAKSAGSAMVSVEELLPNTAPKNRFAGIQSGVHLLAIVPTTNGRSTVNTERCGRISRIVVTLENILYDEQDARDDLPFNLDEGGQAKRMDKTVDLLSAAIACLEQINELVADQEAAVVPSKTWDGSIIL